MSERSCTCHPSEAPHPCQKRYALYECQAARIQQLEAALDVCDRVLHFDLRGMITWGKDYNQAVKDAADAARAALGEK